MREVTSLNPRDIRLGDRLRRSLNREAVDRLKESIARIGLKTPISVQLISDEEGWFLVAGRHRLQACVELGWSEIPVRDESGSELDARLWEIAENLHRTDLTALERAEHIAEWIRLHDEREASLVQDAPVKSRRADGRGGSVGEGVRAAARELGIESTQAKRATQIASLPEDAKDAARENGLDDNQSALLAAQKSSNAKETLDRIASEQEKEARKAKKEADRIILDRRIDGITNWLAARLDVDEMNSLGEMLSGIANPLSKALLREAA